MLMRVGFVGMVLFTWGSPQFDQLRPAAVDKPLVRFHEQARLHVADTTKMLKNYNDFRKWKYVLDGAISLDDAVTRQIRK